MINFRKMFCKGAEKGSWWYNLCDCKRYEDVIVSVCPISGHLPRKYCPPPIEKTFTVDTQPTQLCGLHDFVEVDVCAESFRLPLSWCPNVGVKLFMRGLEPQLTCDIHKPVAKCQHPYHQTGRLAVFTGACLDILSMKDTEQWKEADLPAYYDSLVADGVNSERNASTCANEPGNIVQYWQFGDPEYLPTIKRRLDLIKERDLTEIIVLKPYHADMTDDEARRLIRELKPYLPNVMFEPINEPAENEVPQLKRLIEILVEEGIPKNHIIVEYVDCGDWSDNIWPIVKGESIVCQHWIGSMETVNWKWEPHGSGFAWDVLRSGFIPSNDGQDQFRKALGLNFWADDARQEYRRSSPQQVESIAGWMTQNGGRGFECLSAAAYQHSADPNMADAIAIGRDERLALARGIFG